MSDFLNDVSMRALKFLEEKGSELSLVEVKQSESTEFSVNKSEVNFVRNQTNQKIKMRSITQHRQAQTEGNQFSKEGLLNQSLETIQLCQSSPKDENYAFNSEAAEQSFGGPNESVNLEWMYEACQNLTQSVALQFPEVNLRDSTIQFDSWSSLLKTSTQRSLLHRDSVYSGSIVFSAESQKQRSSFNYIGFVVPANQPQKAQFKILDNYGLRNLLQENIAHLEPKKLPQKFIGDIVVTPYCMGDFAFYWSEAVSGANLLKGKSYLQDKLDQTVANSTLSLMCQPKNEFFFGTPSWTSDADLTQNQAFIENGVLRTYFLNHHAANKLKQKPSLSGAKYFLQQPGKENLKDLIRNVERGVLLARYSAGSPNDNGDISGVAKNSFYIENGEIKHPLTETMVAGNLREMLMNYKACSKEYINNGVDQFCWSKFSGLSIS